MKKIYNLYMLIGIFLFSISVNTHAQDPKKKEIKKELNEERRRNYTKEDIINSETKRYKERRKQVANGSLVNEAELRYRNLKASSVSGDKFKVPEYELEPSANEINLNSQGLINRVQVKNNEYNGNPNVVIDITELKSYDLNVPIKLHYNKAGITVNEMGTEVGHGFELSTGGKLTRVVKGLPDEFIGKVKKFKMSPIPSAYDYNENHFGFQEIEGYGYLNLGVTEYPDPADFYTWSDTKQKEAIKYNSWASIPFHKIGHDDDDLSNDKPIALDFNPDEFYYEAGNYKGMFRFSSPSGTIINTDRDVKIVMNPGGLFVPLGFTITTPDGNVYTFGGSKKLIEKTQNTTLTLTNYYSNEVINCNQLDVLGLSCDDVGYPEWSYPTPTIPSAHISDGNIDIFTTGTWHTNPYTAFQYPEYVSSFLLGNVVAPSGDRLQYSYESAEQVYYTNNKNYSYNSPSIEENDFFLDFEDVPHTHTLLTTNNTDDFDEYSPFYDDCYDPLPNGPPILNHFYKSFSTFSFSNTYGRTLRRRLSSITAQNGYSVSFDYGKKRPDVVNDFLLTDIHLNKGGNTVQSWKLGYDDDHIGNDFDLEYLPLQNIYHLNYYVPLFSSVFSTQVCDIPLNMSDFSSLFDILTDFSLKANDEQDEIFRIHEFINNSQDMYKAEFDRSYLQSITQVGTSGGEIELNNFDYYNFGNGLPRRFDYAQDIWGYQNNNTSGYHLPPITGRKMTSEVPLLLPGCNSAITFDEEIPSYGFVNTNAPGIDFQSNCHYVMDYVDYTNSVLPNYRESTHSTGINKALRNINYNTGASHELIYSRNNYTDDNTPDGSGWRIDKIRVTNPGGASYAEAYTYANATPGNNSIKPKKHLDGRELFGIYDPDFWGWGYRYDKKEPVRLISSQPYNRMPKRKSGLTGYGEVTKEIYSIDGDCETECETGCSEECGFGRVVTSYNTGIPFKEPDTYRIWSSGNTVAIDNFYHVTRADLAWNPNYNTPYGLEGTAETVMTYDVNNNLVKDVVNTFSPSTGIQYKDFFMAWTLDFDSDGSKDAEYYFTDNIYFMTDEPVLSNSIEKIYADDGSGSFVQTITDYGYNSFRNPTSVSMVNSNGQTHEITYEYATDLGNTLLLNNHMINIPLKTILNGEIGKLITYANWSGQIKPRIAYNYEGGSWIKQTEVLDYFVHNLPSTIKKDGYEPQTYTYSPDGNLLTQRYIDRQTTHTYDPTSRLLSSSTTEGLQTTNYSYDEFMRLDNVSSRNGSSTTDISYEIGSGGNTNLAEINIAGSPKVPDILTTYDGLGNLISSSSLGYAADGGDFTNSRRLNAIGNILESCDPSFGGCITNRYEASPLGRLQSSTAPGVSASVITQNLVNSSGDVPGYSPGTLFKTITIDEDGKESHSFTNKIGQTVAVTLTGGNETAQTLYSYNPKGELTFITQPEGDQFSFTYYDDGNLKTKQIPGTTGSYAYTYYENDLLKTATDPNGITVTSIYDDYGQETSVISSADGLVCEKTYYGTIQGKTGKLANRQVKVIGFGINIQESFDYDEYGRQTSSTLLSGLHQAQVNKSNIFNSRDMLDEQTTTLSGGPWTEAFSIKKLDYTYDNGGRLVNSTFKRNADSPFNISSLKYNNNDWVIKRSLGGSTASNPLQVLDYEYNSRGQMSKINNIGSGGLTPKPWGECEEPSCEDASSSIDLEQLLNLLQNQSEDTELIFDCYDSCDSEYDGSGPVDQFSGEDPVLKIKPSDAMEQSILGCSPLEKSIVRRSREEECDTTITIIREPRSVALDNFLGQLEFKDRSNNLTEKEGNMFVNTLNENGKTWQSAGRTGGLVWDLNNLTNVSNQEIDILDYKVIMKLSKKTSLKSITLGLFDGSEMLSLEGHQEKTYLSAAEMKSTEDNNYFYIELTSKERLTESQFNQLKLVSRITDGSVEIEAVCIKITYRIPCPVDCTEELKCDPKIAEAQAFAVRNLQQEFDARTERDMRFPINLVRVRLCDQTEIYLDQNDLSKLGPEGSYLVLDIIVIESVNQALTYEINGIVSDGVFKDLIGEGLKAYEISDVRNINEYKCEPKCNIPVRCDERTSIAQASTLRELQAFIDNMSESEIRLPLNIVRVRLCDQSEVYLLEEQVDQLGPEDSYEILDVIEITSLDQVLTITTQDRANQEILFSDFLKESKEQVFLSLVIVIGDYVCTDPPVVNTDCTLPDCDPWIKEWQQNQYVSIQQQMNVMEPDDIISDELYLVLLCDGRQVFILDQLIDQLPQNYSILQTIDISLEEDPILVSGSATNQLNDLFGMSIAFGESVSPAYQAFPSLNGNISAIEWQATGGPIQGYGFEYDGLNRLVNARHNDKDESGAFTNANRYTLSGVQYSPNGNIQGLLRTGTIGDCENGYTVGTIDRLAYNYDPNINNQLLTVSEGVNDPNFRIRGFNPGEHNTNYLYDSNGNLIYDPYKGMTVTINNHLNLPEKYVLNSSAGEITMTFYYDYLGRLWRKKTIGLEDGPITVDYIDGNEYINLEWASTAHNEGRVVPAGNKYYSQYVIKDHLGNSRVVFGDKNGDDYIQKIDDEDNDLSKEIYQVNHYYPFGLGFEGDFVSPSEDKEVHKYQFNGKENNNYGIDDNDDGFNELALNLHNFGARWYDPAIGRFTGADPMGEEREWLSPYNYVRNNPVLRIDPSGQLDTMPDGRYIWEMTDLEKSIFYDDPFASDLEKRLNEVYRKDYVEKNGEVNLTWKESLYMLGHMFGMALPSAKPLQAAKAVSTGTAAATTTSNAAKVIKATKIPANVLDEVRPLIEKNKFLDAVDHLIKSSELSDDALNTLTLMKARYNRIRTSERMGTETFDDITRGFMKLYDDFLNATTNNFYDDFPQP